MQVTKGISMQDFELPRLPLNRSSQNAVLSSQNLSLKLDALPLQAQSVRRDKNKQFEAIIKGVAGMNTPTSPMLQRQPRGNNNFDNYLHREQIGLNIADQIKMLNEQIDNKSLIMRNKIVSRPLKSINKQQHALPPTQTLQYSNLNQNNQMSILNKRKDLKVFNLTENDDSQVQSLRKVLKICNTSELDKQARMQREKIMSKSDPSIAQIGIKQLNSHKRFKLLNGLKHGGDSYVEEKVKTLKQMYQGFDDDYSVLMGKVDGGKRRIKKEISQDQILSPTEESLDQQTPLEIEKKRFKRIDPIKAEFFFGVRQIVKQQRNQQNRIHEEQIKEDQNLEFLRKRNQISVIIERTKSINQVKKLADRIEDEIMKQDYQISDLLVNLGKRLELLEES